ncbi:MAG: hypothetical protein HY360_04560 [Verrucomicrobia bacterium]|nr:hypothetical protein [Verrucomicrobiota bacterium]
MNTTAHRDAQAAGAEKTAAPVMARDCAGVIPEFGRIPDVTRIFGLKRGFIYGLIGEGTIKSVNLRKPGARTGCRLIHLQSVRAFLHAQMEARS